MASQLTARHVRGIGRLGRRSRRTLLHVALAFAIALLSVPVFGSGASAEEAPVGEGTTQDVTATESGPTDPAPEEPAPGPAPEEPAPDPAPVQDLAPDPAPDPAPGGDSAAQQPADQGGTTGDPVITPQALKGAQVSDAGVQTLATLPGVCDTNSGTGKVSTFMQNTKPDRSGDWANGNMNENKADLAEGEVVPQRVELTDLQSGENELVFTYDVKSGTKWAYDYVLNQSMTNGSSITSWVVKNGAGPVATVEVTFDVPAGKTTSTLYFDAHIASELDHGPGTGAGSISGSPYHVSLVSLNCASTGAKDNQIMASAVDAGMLTVIKDADPADGTDFRFSITPGGDSSTFSLDDDGDPTLPDRVTYRVPPGSYTVEELNIPDGWNLTNVACTKAPTASTATSRTVSIADDETVSCTFTNTKTAYKDLTVTKTAVPSYDRDYDWTVDKSVDGSSSQDIADGQSATFDYSVLVTPSAPKDTGFAVAGTISVANPNSVAVAGVTITDSLPGATCTVVDGQTPVTGPVTIPASGKDFGYTCAMGAGTTATSTGTNTVDLSWTAGSYYGTTGSASGSKGFDFATATPSVSDGSVTVTDDKYDLSTYPGGNVVQATDGPTTFTYPLTWPGEPGACTTYDNTATITERDQDSWSDGARVEVCEGKDLAVSKTVVESYQRTYDWSLTKAVVGESTKDADPATGKATFEYEVTATAGKATDSLWTMSGTIEVSNPNDWAVTLSDVTDSVDVGGGASCTVDKSPGLQVPADGSRTYSYDCAFTDQPSYDGTNTATATWSVGELVSPHTSASGTAAVVSNEWDETPVDKTVTIVDDKTDPAHPVVLGTATWTSEGATKVFRYTGPALEGTEGECVDYTNTAWIEELPAKKDTATVTVCRQADLVVSKTAMAAYDTTYFWDVSKKADRTYAEVGPDGEAEFVYTIVAEPTTSQDSGWRMSGTITLRNPNTFEDVTATLSDTYDGGGVCTPEQTEVVVPKATKDGEMTVPGTAEVDYSCTFTSKPAYAGTNTATATWDGGKATGTKAVTFQQDARTDHEVDVYDDLTEPAAEPKLLGTVSWDDPLKDRTFESRLSLGGAPGRCVDHTNTAWVDLTDGDVGLLAPQWTLQRVDPSASQTVTVCEEKALDVTKTVDASFGRAYHWKIDKAVDRTHVELTDAGEATFHYTVEATPDGYTDSGYAMSGTVTVTNPNAYEGGAITAKVTDDPSVGGGATCEVAGGASVTLAPGETKELSYSCAFTGTPTKSGTNTATATWTGPDEKQHSSSTDPEPVTFVAEAHVNKTVTVTDDMADPETLGEATWNESGTPAEFEYSLTHAGRVGTCVDYTNTARITETGQSDSETVTVCDQDDLVVTKTVDATLDRTYLWDISKVADRSHVATDEGESASVTYTVGVTPTGYLDNGWEMSGAVTILNPNDYKDVTVSLTDVPDVGEGATCAFDGVQDLVIPAGGTRAFDYSCTFEAQPEYDGSNTVVVAWGHGQVSDTTDVAFEVAGETDRTVTVTDDLRDPSELGQATWDEGATTVEFEYTLAFEGPAGDCETVTNTATIVETGQQAQADVEVCGPEIAPNEEEKPPAKPRPPAAILPSTGAPAGAGRWAMLGGLLVALGGALVMRRRRDAS